MFTCIYIKLRAFAEYRPVLTNAKLVNAFGYIFRFHILFFIVDKKYKRLQTPVTAAPSVGSLS